MKSFTILVGLLGLFFQKFVELDAYPHRQFPHHHKRHNLHQAVYYKASLFDDPHVFLTVHAQAGIGENDNLLDRRLELNWHNIEPTGSNWIGVFDINPSLIFERADALFSHTLNATQASVLSSIRIEPEVIENLLDHSDSEGCIGYWVAYFESEDAFSPSLINCLRINPAWMESLRSTIGDRPLTDLMIPGTHNAGAWKHYNKSDEINLVVKYAYNQEEDIYTQLTFGVRFFDLRIAYYPGTAEKFWINHDVIRLRPFITLVNDVHKFLDETEAEVLLLDMHNFPVGFGEDESSEEVHAEFITYLSQHFGNLVYLKTQGSNPTLNQVINSGKRIIISYDQSTMADRHDFLWRAVEHAWGNVNDVSELEIYLAETIPRLGCKGSFWSSMAELTPTSDDIILKPRFGLRGFAQLVNIPVTNWFRAPEWYSKANIVATDFFLGTNIIEMSILVNAQSASCPAR